MGGNPRCAPTLRGRISTENAQKEPQEERRECLRLAPGPAASSAARSAGLRARELCRWPWGQPGRALHRAEELSGQGGSSDRPLQREWKGLHVRSGLRTDTRFPAARSPCRSPGRGPGRSPRLSAAVVMTNPACVAGSRSPPAAADVNICCDVCTLMSANPTKKCF